MSTTETIVSVELDDPSGTFTLREFCERGECHAEFVIKLVSYGIIAPVEEQRGLAMSLDLLDEIHDMRREVDRLNRLLAQFIVD